MHLLFLSKTPFKVFSDYHISSGSLLVIYQSISTLRGSIQRLLPAKMLKKSLCSAARMSRDGSRDHVIFERRQ